MSFSQNTKKSTSKVIQELDAEKNVDTSRFWTRKPKSCNNHTSNFHILDLRNLDFFQILGDGGGNSLSNGPINGPAEAAELLSRGGASYVIQNRLVVCPTMGLGPWGSH